MRANGAVQRNGSEGVLCSEKRPLACPKTVAGLFLVAFESPIFAPRALSFFRRGEERLPKTI